MGEDEIKVTDKRGQTKTENTEDSYAAKTQGQQQDKPDISFSNLIVSLGTSAMIHMGMIENPHSKQMEKNLDLAREEIDLISMLQEKTKGNLTDAEAKVVQQVLYELRLRYVEASK